MANQPLSQYIRKAWQDFSGGLNTKESPIKVPPNQLVKCENALINKRGIIETSKGHTIDGSPFPDSPDSFIRLTHNYKQGLAVDTIIVAARDNSNSNVTYKVDLKNTSGDGVYDYIGHTTGTATFTNGDTNVNGTTTAWLANLKAGDKIKPDAGDTWYEIASVTNDLQLVLTTAFDETTTPGSDASPQAYTARIILDKDFIPSAVTFNDVAIITNGKDGVMSYNNTTLDLIPDAPHGKFVVLHKSRVFILGDVLNPSNINWCAVNDELTWDAAAYEPVYEYDNGVISGGTSFADSLIVVKNNGNMYQIVGSFDDSAVGEVSFIRKIDTPTNMGAIFGGTLAVDEGLLWFLTETGFYNLDSGMRITRVSDAIQPTTEEISTLPTTIANNTLLYDTAVQWGQGTNNGTIVSTEGTLSPEWAYTTLTDATQRHNCLSSKLDSNNTLHVAYVDAVNLKSIRYYAITSLGVETREIAVTHDVDIYALSLDVSSNGTVGIAWTEGDLGTYTGPPRLVERTAGVWGTPEDVGTSTAPWPLSPYTAYTPGWPNTKDYFTLYTSIRDVVLKYNSTNKPTVGITGGAYMQYAYHPWGYSDFYVQDIYYTIVTMLIKPSGTWVANKIYSTTHYLSAQYYNPSVRLSYDSSHDNLGYLYAIDTEMVSDNPQVVFAYGPYFILCYITADAGVTYTRVEYISTYPTTGMQLVVNAAGNLITAFTDASTAKMTLRNHTTATTSILDADATAKLLGFVISDTVSADQQYYYYTSSSAPTVEKCTYESSTVLVNSTTGVVSTATTLQGQCLSSNGRVFGMCAWGSSTNTIVVRRMAFNSYYKTYEVPLTTLQVWGTYQDTKTLNAGTITTSGSFYTTDQGGDPLADNLYTYPLVNDSVVGVLPTKVYTSILVTFVLGDFLRPSVSSAQINYIGEGVDGKKPYATVFNGDYLCSCTEVGEDANNKVILRDIGGAWIEHFHAVGPFCRYKQTLYAGSSTNGDIYKLYDGYLAGDTSYTLDVITKEDLLGSLELDKDLFKAYVLFEVKTSGSFTFQYRTNNFTSSDGASWTSQTVDMTSNGIAEIHIGKTAKSIQFRVTADSALSPIGILGFVVMFKYLNVR